MSKRAEEKALEAYPPEMRKAFELLPKDWNKPLRAACVKGYELAEKDLILRTKRWIKEIHRVCDITDEHGYSIELRDLIASFEKSIEEV